MKRVWISAIICFAVWCNETWAQTGIAYYDALSLSGSVAQLPGISPPTFVFKPADSLIYSKILLKYTDHPDQSTDYQLDQKCLFK